MLAKAYLDAAQAALAWARQENLDRINEVAGWLTTALQAGGILWVFGSTHASIPAQELFYRAGGLVPINPLFAPGLVTTVRPITLTSELERVAGYGQLVVEQSRVEAGDVVIVVSVSGRNSVPIDVALAAKQRRAKVIAVTSVAYSQVVASRHPSGKRLCDLNLDAVLDIGGCPGDAAIAIPRTAVRSGPTSSIVAIYLLNALVVEVAGQLVAAGWNPPPVFISANMEGGDQHNRELLKRYGNRLTYL